MTTLTPRPVARACHPRPFPRTHLVGSEHHRAAAALISAFRGLVVHPALQRVCARAEGARQGGRERRDEPAATGANGATGGREVKHAFPPHPPVGHRAHARLRHAHATDTSQRDLQNIQPHHALRNSLWAPPCQAPCTRGSAASAHAHQHHTHAKSTHKHAEARTSTRARTGASRARTQSISATHARTHARPLRTSKLSARIPPDARCESPDSPHLTHEPRNCLCESACPGGRRGRSVGAATTWQTQNVRQSGAAGAVGCAHGQGARRAGGTGACAGAALPAPRFSRAHPCGNALLQHDAVQRVK